MTNLDIQDKIINALCKDEYFGHNYPFGIPEQDDGPVPMPNGTDLANSINEASRIIAALRDDIDKADRIRLALDPSEAVRAVFAKRHDLTIRERLLIALTR